MEPNLASTPPPSAPTMGTLPTFAMIGQTQTKVWNAECVPLELTTTLEVAGRGVHVRAVAMQPYPPAAATIESAAIVRAVNFPTLKMQVSALFVPQESGAMRPPPSVSSAFLARTLAAFLPLHAYHGPIAS